MRSILIIAALAAIAIPFDAPSASASEPKPFGLAVFGSYQSYAMSDVNDFIKTPGALFPGAIAIANKIDGGAGFGAGLRAWPSERVRVALDVSRLLAKTTGSGIYLSTPYTGELKLPATSVTATLSYFFPPLGRVRPGLGAGVGYYLCTGRASVNFMGTTSEASPDGSGFGIHGEGVLDVSVAGALHAEIGAGYRHATTTDLEMEGAVLRNADGSKTQVDWSGVWGRAGLTVYLGRGPTGT
jgi:hypothetical protein